MSLEHLLLQEHFRQRRMAFVVGPRQVGKTTLGQALLKIRHSTDLYRNWDDPAWRAAFAREPFAFVDRYRAGQAGERPLVVLDEIHRYPRWKRFLKGLWDTRKDRVDVLVTGSGRLDVYQRGGDSLLGRYHQYRMHPRSWPRCRCDTRPTCKGRPQVAPTLVDQPRTKPRRRGHSRGHCRTLPARHLSQTVVHRLTSCFGVIPRQGTGPGRNQPWRLAFGATKPSRWVKTEVVAVVVVGLQNGTRSPELHGC